MGGIVVFLVIYFRSTICDCKARISYEDTDLNEGIDLDELYKSTDSIELSGIKESWQASDLSADSFYVAWESFANGGRKLLIVEHFTKGAKHFGAIIFPSGYDERKPYPLLVWANGLDQNDPSVYLEHNVVQRLRNELPDYFIIVPSYRGQALVHHKKRYCSDGFFGDAFDGATEDALRLLALAKREYKGIDENRIVACGVSRGGTVALLIGIRDTSINNVISIAGPTDFFSKTVYHRFGFQYKYQFLSQTRSMDEIRAKMLKSSPVYFIEDYPNSVLIVHGKNDRTVALSNATKVIDKLDYRANFSSIITEGGHAFYEWDKVIEWIRKNNI